MMNIKNHNGFTLIEALIAMVIAAIILVPLFSLFNTTITQVGTRSERMEKILYAKEFLYKARMQAKLSKNFNLENKENPEYGMVTYTRKPVEEKSVFANITGLLKEEVIISWQHPNGQQSESLITYIYVPEQEEQKS